MLIKKWVWDGDSLYCPNDHLHAIVSYTKSDNVSICRIWVDEDDKGFNIKYYHCSDEDIKADIESAFL